MPLTGDAPKVMAAMQKEYGDKRGKNIYYATANKQGRKPETFKKKSSTILALILKKHGA